MPAHTSADSALHLRVDGISRSFLARRVLTDVSFVVPAGVPTGLLGENGSGKTTLLRIIAGELAPDAGETAAPGPVGLLRQNLPAGPGALVGTVLAEALEVSRSLERELSRAGEEIDGGGPAAAERYDELLTRATLADVWNASARAEQVLAGLGLADLPRDRRIDDISGGQRARLSLARLLIARPTTLLLDEPTNHLDDDATVFLAGLLAGHPGPVLVASHDRAFLDEAARAQVDLDPAPSPLEGEPGGTTVHTGTFTDYMLARLEARERWERRFRDEQEELNRLRTAVRENHQVGHPGAAPRTEGRAARKYYADRNATVVSRRVRDVERRLAELERCQVRKPPRELHFTGVPPAAGRASDGVLLAAQDVAVPGRLRPTSLALARGEKLLVTGENGAGKSTLLRLLVGELEPERGSVQRPAGLRIAHLDQDESIDPEQTVRSLLAGEADAAPELFGLVHPRDLDRPLGELSRGQQRRAALAALLAEPPDLLVLDEPTNHLALDVATRLERALGHWPGTVVIASHDRWLRARWDGRSLALGPADR